jgi:hypothetical protein
MWWRQSISDCLAKLQQISYYKLFCLNGECLWPTVKNANVTLMYYLPTLRHNKFERLWRLLLMVPRISRQNLRSCLTSRRSCPPVAWHTRRKKYPTILSDNPPQSTL